jgi:ribosomal protein S15P/S13E
MPFNFFKKLFRSEAEAKPKQQGPIKVALKSLDYSPKILVAWAKAVEGNQEFMDWLQNNGYQELSSATAAIKLNEKARKWLMDNGYPHLLAFIQAAESNKKALRWLENNGFMLLSKMARAIDDETEALDWIHKTQPVDIIVLTLAIKKVKDHIEDYNNDVHVYK